MHEFTYDGYRRLTKDKDGLLFETLFAYDNHGNTNSVTDALLKVWTYSNDVLGRVLTTTGPIAGLVWTNVYDAATGWLTEARDPRSVRSTLEYSSRGWITRQVAADGSTTPQVALSTFDVAGQQTGVRDGNGYWAQTQFDMRGRPVAVFDAAGSVIRREFDAAGQRTASRDEQGFRTGFSVNSRGWTTQSTNALTQNTSFGYDAAGNRTSTTDALSHVWSTEFNDAGQAIKLTNPLLQFSQTVYNTLGQAEQNIDEAGRIGKQLYDVLGRPTTRTDGFGTALARNNTTGYNGRGNVSSQADGLNQTTNFGYDDAGRRTTTTDPLVHVWTTGFDLGGRATTSTDPLSKTTNLGYDDLGRQTSATDPNNNTTTKIYDGEGRLVAEWDGAGNITHHVYDAAGREVLTIAPDGGLTQRSYEDRGLLTSLTDPVGNITRWEYDALGRASKEIDPTGASKTFEYDAAGRMTRATDRLGRVKEFAYDNANRLTSEVWKASLGGAIVDTLTYTYFADGRIASAANSEGTYSFTFDELARTKTQTGLFGLTLTLGYNAADDLTSLADSLGGTVASVYDAAHRLTSRAFSGASNGARAEFGYNNRNERTETRRYDAATAGTKVSSTDFGFDDGGRMSSEVHKDGAGTPLVTYANTFDAANRITSETRNGTPKNFTYDVNSQVTSDGTSNYSFDANGNRTMAGYTTGTDNRITSDGTWNYTYDAEGNQTKKVRIADGRTWTFGYDHRNQMKWAEERATDGGTLLQRVDYGNDVYGNLVREVVTISGNSTTTKHAYRITDAGLGFTKSVHEAWADLDSAGALTLRYLAGLSDGEILARITPAGVESWLLQDRLGSVREILDSLGVIVKTLGFDAFGNIIVETGGADRGLYLWAGGRFCAASGLFFFHWRPYDPATGRFGAPDPIGFAGGLMNLYGYSGNNSTNAVDPSGLDDFDVSTLKPNWKNEYGFLYHHADVVEISIKGKSGNELQKVADGIYARMSTFRDFNSPNNIANIKIVEKDDMRYGGFEVEGTAAWASRRIGGDGPGNRMWVQLFDGKLGPAQLVAAVTLGNHVLAGVRVWSVHVKDDKIIVATETFERRSSRQSNTGFHMRVERDFEKGGVSARLKGVVDTEKIWRQYLKDIAEKATKSQTIGSYAFGGAPLSEFPWIASMLIGGTNVSTLVLGLNEGILPRAAMELDVRNGRNPFRKLLPKQVQE